MDNINITAAEYRQDVDGSNSCVAATIDGKVLLVPMSTGNRHYQAILDWVAEGNTIADAD